MFQNSLTVLLVVAPLSIAIILQNFKNTNKPDKEKSMTMDQLPVFALSHGGPTFMYEDSAFGGDKGAFQCTRRIGEYIEEVIKPKYIIYVSAHWQSRANNEVLVGVPVIQKTPITGPLPENGLIYDFYGFPKHMYEEEFHSKNDPSVANRIVKDLNSHFSDSPSLMHASLAKRGIDHGVWVPLKVAFPDKPDKYWNTEIPIIQVSLAADDTDFDFHYELGRALSKYRAEGALVIVSGMSVHNLRDIGRDNSGNGLPYAKEFNRFLTDVLTDEDRNDKLSDLKKLLVEPAKREMLYSAHPTLEHFLPFIVGLGAGEGCRDSDGGHHVQELYNNERGSLGWGIYQYGEYETSERLLI